MILQQEIQKLNDYVKKHKVKYVDVQIELVDHLATEIEAIRIENPTIDFQSALEKASSTFDVKTYSQSPHTFGSIKYLNGFAQLQNQKEIYAYKLLNRKMTEYLLSFVKLPRIITTIGIWLIIYLMLGICGPKWVVVFVFGFQLLATFYWGLKTYIFQKESGKFMALQIQSGTLLASFLLFFPYLTIEFIRWLDSSTAYFPLIVVSISTFLILASYIAFIYFTDLLISEIKDKYGNHKLNFG